MRRVPERRYIDSTEPRPPACTVLPQLLRCSLRPPHDHLAGSRSVVRGHPMAALPSQPSHMAPWSGGVLLSLKGSTTHDASVQRRVVPRQLVPSVALALASTDRETADDVRRDHGESIAREGCRLFACQVARLSGDGPRPGPKLDERMPQTAVYGLAWAASSHVHDRRATRGPRATSCCAGCIDSWC